MARTSPSVDETFRRKEPDPKHLTNERIADLDAFRKAGGRIEVLGLTQVLKKLKNPRRLAPHPITLLVIGARCRATPKIVPAQHEHGVK